MPYCQKCGNKVDENMVFCPRCGASLKDQASSAQAPPPVYHRRDEKQEKNEKREKQDHPEKGEKHEKGEFGFIGFLIGGLVLILIGVFSVLQFTGYLPPLPTFAILLLLIGIVIIIAAVYATITARKRYPHPSAT
jgi:hypothetical protein